MSADCLDLLEQAARAAPREFGRCRVRERGGGKVLFEGTEWNCLCWFHGRCNGAARKAAISPDRVWEIWCEVDYRDISALRAAGWRGPGDDAEGLAVSSSMTTAPDCLTLLEQAGRAARRELATAGQAGDEVELRLAEATFGATRAAAMSILVAPVWAARRYQPLDAAIMMGIARPGKRGPEAPDA